MTSQTHTTQSLEGAAHHVYADQPDDFHEIVNSICNKCDWSVCVRLWRHKHDDDDDDTE